MSNIRQTLKQVAHAKKVLNKLNAESNLLPISMQQKLKDLEMSLFVQQCRLEDMATEEAPVLKAVKKSA